MSVDAKNVMGKRGGTKRGGHDEANYAGQAQAQKIDWDTTSGGRGYYSGTWRDSPWGRPITYNGVLSAARNAGNDAGPSALDVGLGSVGNAGQAAILEIMGPQVLINAWHYQANGYGDASDYINQHCAYPSAVESIIEDMGATLEEFQSTDY